MTRLALDYNRTWSAPGHKVPDEALIASVLDRPTLDDLLTLCERFGCDRVKTILALMEQNDEIGLYARKISERMLGNIEIGLSRVQRRTSTTNTKTS